MPIAGNKTKTIITKVAGVTQSNPDGTERQDIIKELKMGENILLVRDYENEHDLYATQVQTESGQVIGWVPRQRTPEVGAWLDEGLLTIAGVVSRGSDPGKKTVGVNIEIMLIGEAERQVVETELRNHERWKRQELRRLSEPRPDPVPTFQVTECEGFPKSVILLCIGLFLFMACGFAVCGG